MKKLFEIPIYVLSASKLNIRPSERISELKKLFSRSNPNEAAAVIDHETLPMRSWDYNHIIGYIQIAVSKTDILFEVFLPIPIPMRYVWYTSRKIYVQNICANGTHIYWGSLKTNGEFCEAFSDVLDQVITDHISARFHVDREAFDAINGHLDYLTIVQDA